MVMPTSLIENLKNDKILVIGDLMLDHYLWGDVHCISPKNLAGFPVKFEELETWLIKQSDL
jgi:bifunctional ADP-heptose synthase (sugar kinase/adenylyltransferase)